MGSKKLKFTSALVCAAFAPQAIGFCASGVEKNAAKKNAEKYKNYLDGSIKPNIFGKSAENGHLDDDFEGEDLDFDVKTRGKSSKKKGIFSGFFSRVSSYKRRYRKLVNFVKNVAIYGAFGYSAINFAPLIIEKVSGKSTVDSDLFADSVNQNVLKLMQNPKVDFSFVVSDTDGKELNEVTKKESVGDVSTFLANFEKMYKETGGNIDVSKFESGITADFENDSGRERMVRYCANLRSLPVEGIAKYSDLGDNDVVRKQLESVINFEYMKISGAAASSKKGEYHGFSNEKGSEDFKRDVYNMLQGAKKAGLEVGGQTLSAIGNTLTMALPGWYKIIGVLCTAGGALVNYFNNDKKLQDQKSLTQ